MGTNWAHADGGIRKRARATGYQLPWAQRWAQTPEKMRKRRKPDEEASDERASSGEKNREIGNQAKKPGLHS